MSRRRTPEDAKYWLDEAEERLEHARGYVAGRNARILCEQAHYAAEFAIKGLIIAAGHSFVTTHDIKELLETARDAGETIPTEVNQAKGLSTYAGGGRYDFDRDPGLAWVGKDEYGGAVEAAAATVKWARERSLRILREHNRTDPEASS